MQTATQTDLLVMKVRMMVYLKISLIVDDFEDYDRLAAEYDDGDDDYDDHVDNYDDMFRLAGFFGRFENNNRK